MVLTAFPYVSVFSQADMYKHVLTVSRKNMEKYLFTGKEKTYFSTWNGNDRLWGYIISPDTAFLILSPFLRANNVTFAKSKLKIPLAITE